MKSTREKIVSGRTRGIGEDNSGSYQDGSWSYSNQEDEDKTTDDFFDEELLERYSLLIRKPAPKEKNEDYFLRLKKNYFPEDQDGNDITNILDYIELDENGKPYTDENGAAIFNEKGEQYLENKDWMIEPKDVFHEEDGNPVVKLTHKDGGEQIYDLISGDLITNQEYGGTFNIAQGPYNIKHIKNTILHGADVLDWITDGGGPDDPSSRKERNDRLKKGSENPHGLPYRNIKP